MVCSSPVVHFVGPTDQVELVGGQAVVACGSMAVVVGDRQQVDVLRQVLDMHQS